MDKLAVVDMDTVTAVLGVTEKTVRTWVSDFGCPSNKEGRTRSFYWPDVLTWYVGYASAKQAGVTAEFAPEDEPATGPENLTQANLRKTRAEADLKQLQLAKQRGEHIAIADAKSRLDRMMNNLRSRLLGLPPKINARVSGIKEPSRREAAIKEEVEAVAREISTGSVVDVPASFEEDESETVPEITAAAEPAHIFTDRDFGLA